MDLKATIHYQFKGDNIPSFSFKYRTLQTALVANIGYKYINLFAQAQPNIATIRAYKPMEAGKPFSSIQATPVPISSAYPSANK